MKSKRVSVTRYVTEITPPLGEQRSYKVHAVKGREGLEKGITVIHKHIAHGLWHCDNCNLTQTGTNCCVHVMLVRKFRGEIA